MSIISILNKIANLTDRGKNSAVEMRSLLTEMTSTLSGTSISNTSDLINDGEDGNNPFITNLDLSAVTSGITSSFEGYNESGTRISGVTVTIGDYDISNSGTTVTVNDVSQTVNIRGLNQTQMNSDLIQLITNRKYYFRMNDALSATTLYTPKFEIDVDVNNVDSKSFIFDYSGLTTGYEITAQAFNKINGTSDDILLGDGSTISIGDLTGSTVPPLQDVTTVGATSSDIISLTNGLAVGDGVTPSSALILMNGGGTSTSIIIGTSEGLDVSSSLFTATGKPVLRDYGYYNATTGTVNGTATVLTNNTATYNSSIIRCAVAGNHLGIDMGVGDYLIFDNENDEWIKYIDNNQNVTFTGTSEEVILGDGSTTALSGLTGGTGGTPGGNDTEIQFNDNGSFGSSSNLTFDGDELLMSGNNLRLFTTDAAEFGSEFYAKFSKASSGTNASIMKRFDKASGNGLYFGEVLLMDDNSSSNGTGTVGLFTQVDKEGSGDLDYLYGQQIVVRHRGASDVGFLNGLTVQLSVDGSSTLGVGTTTRGISPSVTIDNANATVQVAQGMHPTLNLRNGTIVDASAVMYLDIDYLSSGNLNIQGNLSYIQAGNDTQGLSVGGTKRFIHYTGFERSDLNGPIYTNIDVNTISTGTSKILTTKEYTDSTFTKKYSETIGDNSATGFTITHGLDTEDVVVTIRKVSNGEIEFTDIFIVDGDNVNIQFTTPPTINEYRVIIIG